MQPKHTRKRRRRQRVKPHPSRRPTLELPWPEDPRRPVFCTRRVRYEAESRGKLTPYGGLGLAHGLVQALELPAAIDRNVVFFKVPRPYHESDHVLTHAYNLFAGGTCIEDIASLQASEAFQNLTGACRVPDPTTAGDFLRRFDTASLGFLQHAFDGAHEKVWKALPRRKRRVATVDLDSTIKEVYGECKEGADFSYKGTWSYHPLLVSVEETNECLRIINRPGNRPSMEGAAGELDECLGLLTGTFGKVQVRGDSACYEEKIIRTCEAWKADFAFVMKSCPELLAKAESLSPQAFQPFSSESPEEAARRRCIERRRRRPRTRKARARARGYRTLNTTRQWVAEFRYRPSWDKEGEDYRVVVKRQLVRTSEGQRVLFNRYHYRFILTSFKHSRPADVVRFAYGRCAQENTIEQLKNGIAAMRMPTGQLLANAAFVMAAQLAWNLRAWLSLLALPEESLHWEWKRFRQAFVYVAARVVRKAHTACARISSSHRFAPHILAASRSLDALVFR